MTYNIYIYIYIEYIEILCCTVLYPISLARLQAGEVEGLDACDGFHHLSWGLEGSGFRVYLWGSRFRVYRSF